jgi:SsrA-binding protein
MTARPQRPASNRPVNPSAGKVVAENRRARFDYAIEDTLEAGLMLTGSEVKSLRAGRANIAESYAAPEHGELWLINGYIPEYGPANRFNHEPRRKRKILVKRRELAKLMAAVQREGRTIVPLKIYWNDRGIAKLSLAIAKGKKAADKRDTSKERDWKREQGRLLRDKG